MVSDNSDMRGLHISVLLTRLSCGTSQPTPFIIAKMVSGSVAMEASSIKTIGKSILDNLRDAAESKVVQIYHEYGRDNRYLQNNLPHRH
jgi:hypothetical protein